MLTEHSIFGIQSMHNVDDFDRLDSVTFEEYVRHCRRFTIDNTVNNVASVNDNNETKTKRLISLIETFVEKHQKVVEGYITNIGTVDKGKLLSDLIDTITGYGVLKDAFEDPNIDEIQINDYKTIFVIDRGIPKPLLDKKGQPLQFFNNDEVHTLLNRLIEDGTGALPQFTEGKPIMNTKTAKDGFRVSAVHSAANARDGGIYNFPITTVVIRKFKKVKLQMADIEKSNTLTHKMGKFLRLVGRADISLFCVGKTGSGKTTLLNIIGEEIPITKRILTVQNPTELTFFDRDEHGRNRRNVVHWEAKSGLKNADEPTSPTMAHLLENTLRFTPEVTIIGESRTPEEFGQLKASLETGQPVMGTFHAGSAAEAIGRMATAVGGDLESKILFSTTVDLVVAQNRFADGTRRVMEISEICGLNPDNSVKVNTLFKFELTGRTDINPKNHQPHAYGRFVQVGVPSDKLINKFYMSSIGKDELAEFLQIGEPSEEV